MPLEVDHFFKKGQSCFHASLGEDDISPKLGITAYIQLLEFPDPSFLRILGGRDIVLKKDRIWNCPIVKFDAHLPQIPLSA